MCCVLFGSVSSTPWGQKQLRRLCQERGPCGARASAVPAAGGQDGPGTRPAGDSGRPVDCRMRSSSGAGGRDRWLVSPAQIRGCTAHRQSACLCWGTFQDAPCPFFQSLSFGLLLFSGAQPWRVCRAPLCAHRRRAAGPGRTGLRSGTRRRWRVRSGRGRGLFWSIQVISAGRWW